MLITVFNVGEYRRKAAPHSISNSDFFRPDNKEAQEIREYDSFILLFVDSFRNACVLFHKLDAVTNYRVPLLALKWNSLEFINTD